MAPTASPIILAASSSVFDPTSIISTSNFLIPSRLAQEVAVCARGKLDSMEYNIAPLTERPKFFAAAWDAEASEEEKLATEALMTRIRELRVPVPFMKELVRFGTQFIGYRDYAGELEEKLAEANKRADALAIELEQSESAHTKTVEDLQKRLDDTKRALEENVAQHAAREEEILGRLETQSRRFVRRTHQEYELENPEDDELLDALSLLEIHGTEARNGLDEAEAGLSRSSPISSIKRSDPQFSLTSPSASTAMKTLDSNFVKRD
ncbi:hypothetical protein QYE76_065414 [Lolium multiflorum]|uniref:Uncharacterized protein n=1 Tax=Lolium multiflorum TaxID=4521 RepID=A0AAD8S8U3_LOLMU|nr:hypothetical protein QYE76_065414 [Lolium multiflorum]